MTLPMAAMPAVIAESLKSVLAAHGYAIARQQPVCGPPFIEVHALDEPATAAVLREVGNNTTQALFAIDESEAFHSLGFGLTYELRRAYLEHGLDDIAALAAIIRLEQGVGSVADVERLQELAELAGLPWAELFPDVKSPTPPPNGEASEERGGAVEPSTPVPAPSRSGCTSTVGAFVEHCDSCTCRGAP